jgi:glycosyltransferase involved in cell wall biosynthesis
MNESLTFRKTLKVAIVHDWLVSYRGGEKVLESIVKLFPSAPIYTLFYNPKDLPESFRSRDIRYSKNLNRFRKIRKLLLPILPSAIESIDLKGYDLIISTSSCVAKGIIPSVGSKHICYIHSPMRYIWDQRKEYFASLERIPIFSSILNLLLSRLRVWDVVSSSRVDAFIANSEFVRQRVLSYYRRESKVIHPPVSLKNFHKKSPVQKIEKKYFLVAGAFVPYKRFDIAIEACRRLGMHLVVVGSGPSEKYLRSLAGDTTEFVIAPNQKQLAEWMHGAQALIFPGVEDFGIVPIEAMASGTPVIALKEGGALDYIEPEMNGLFFNDQTIESLIEVLKKFKKEDFNSDRVIQSTERFSEERFLSQMHNEIDRCLGGYQ